MLKNIKLLARYIYKEYFDGYALKSYSQEGEDMIIRRFFEHKKTGFYVDVGAHHPKRFSNTYYFYKKGWKGINIDAMPGSMKNFRKKRTRDINIEKPVSQKKQLLTYYAFNEPALNGFSKNLSLEREKDDKYFIKFTREIETSTLDQILSKNLKKDQKIDFLTIDVEGLDFEVLKSNDFLKFKPKLILIEMYGHDFKQIENSKIMNFLKSFNYNFFCKTVNTVFFVHSD